MSTPQWPADHEEKHREAAKKGWEGRRSPMARRHQAREVKRKRGESSYLSEMVNYGGEMMTRGEEIKELEKAYNGNQQLIDRYLQGQEHSMRQQQSFSHAYQSALMEEKRLEKERNRTKSNDERHMLTQRLGRARYLRKAIGEHRNSEERWRQDARHFFEEFGGAA